MKLAVDPPKPWPNWQAPVSTRKTRPTIMERAVEGKTQSGNSDVFGSFHLCQGNDDFFARKRESFFKAFFSRVSAKKKLGVFWVFFWVFFGCFFGVFLCFFSSFAR